MTHQVPSRKMLLSISTASPGVLAPGHDTREERRAAFVYFGSNPSNFVMNARGMGYNLPISG
ncbi:hypothetical protein NITHO_6300002 [Nitrolancea hollandica Lb]|uniref:Uncharacterized protein n=1 Tax=Nitrolancea hollandica Lb TaxID=1129897 RepID=I4EMP6_9BACT|nr:hypothetical protein NITHO_6300002 [Nitrolancea hollandica Lb]